MQVDAHNWRVRWTGWPELIEGYASRELAVLVAMESREPAVAECYIPGIGWVPETKVAKEKQDGRAKG